MEIKDFGILNQYCYNCNNLLTTLYRNPIVLKCIDCEECYVIPERFNDDPKRVKRIIELQFIVYSKFDFYDEDEEDEEGDDDYEEDVDE